MNHVERKQERVHDLVVGLGEDLVQAAAELLLRLLGLIGSNPADHGVHRMVRAAGVDRNPAHASIPDPLGKRAGGTGMPDEIPRLVHA